MRVAATWHKQIHNFVEASDETAALECLDQIRGTLDVLDVYDRCRFCKSDFQSAIRVKRNMSMPSLPEPYYMQTMWKLSIFGSSMLLRDETIFSKNNRLSSSWSPGNAPTVVPIQWTKEIHRLVTLIMRCYFEGSITEIVPGVLMEHIFSYVYNDDKPVDYTKPLPYAQH